ncbi:MAG: hypothetical protein HY928_13670 [Elusimicrobia bacterium]|nr:hypothetical protein [Elusimicrobiota bacterium]
MKDPFAEDGAEIRTDIIRLEARAQAMLEKWVSQLKALAEILASESDDKDDVVAAFKIVARAQAAIGDHSGARATILNKAPSPYGNAQRGVAVLAAQAGGFESALELVAMTSDDFGRKDAAFAQVAIAQTAAGQEEAAAETIRRVQSIAARLDFLLQTAIMQALRGDRSTALARASEAMSIAAEHPSLYSLHMAPIRANFSLRPR